jgi:hypothetical protein
MSSAEKWAIWCVGVGVCVCVCVCLCVCVQGTEEMQSKKTILNGIHTLYN